MACMRVEDWEPKVQSVVDRCVSCDAAIWVALSSPRNIAHRICMQCFFRDYASEIDTIDPPTKRQLADLKRAPKR